MNMIQLRIKEILREKNMPVSELAHKMEKSQPYISNVINGKQGVSIRILQKIAEVLGVPVASLFSDYVPPVCPHCGEAICD